MWTSDIGRACTAALLTVGLAVFGIGCSSDTPSTTGDTPSSGGAVTAGNGGNPSDRTWTHGVRASVVQQRIDEGTRRIGIEVTLDKTTSLYVVGVQLRSAGFETVPATGKDTAFAPGQVIDLTTVYGKPLCDGADPTRGLSAVLTIENSAGSQRTLEVPVTARGAGLVRRLHEAECARLRLRQAASISYTAFTRASVDGDEVLVGALELERPTTGGSRELVLVDSLSGSVLFDFLPIAEATPRYVARLAPGAERLLLPVLIGSNGRCDQHARSQSTQTFLFSAYVRVGSAVEHREIVVPPRRLQRQALALLDDVC